MHVDALLFDVFGTVVDWRGSVIEAGQRLSGPRGWRIDWETFADLWRREGYLEPTAQIARGERPWERVEALHRRKLDELLGRFGLTGLSHDEIDGFNRVWHRLAPWPDSIPGLTRLRRKFLITPLSNGDFILLTNMAKHSALPWDCILSSDLFLRFKPNPEIYLAAVKLLDLPASRALMVAAHTIDLEAARSTGMRTAFVERPMEFGPDGPREKPPNTPCDIIAKDFLDLADQLGA